MLDDTSGFWHDWTTETWQRSRAQFEWWHPCGVAALGFVVQWWREDWVRAAVALWENVQTAGLAVAAWAILVLLVQGLRSIPAIYERRLAELRSYDALTREGLPLVVEFEHAIGSAKAISHSVVIANRSSRSLSLDYWYVIHAKNPETGEPLHWSTPDVALSGLSEQLQPNETQRGTVTVLFTHVEPFIAEARDHFLHLRDRISGRMVKLPASGRYRGPAE